MNPVPAPSVILRQLVDSARGLRVCTIFLRRTVHYCHYNRILSRVTASSRKAPAEICLNSDIGSSKRHCARGGPPQRGVALEFSAAGRSRQPEPACGSPMSLPKEAAPRFRPLHTAV
ncbi:hypothetical protein Y032_0071g527 [Ancylostoma ceylanicum]|uniref:Uncharacterized protein n=1 Tax=Ancylostoma ceylanicum TaxID=53326 RepID=A0A016TWM1_9BILA|nr:hypothetical protein Y032_0071g527 [Ancylostoma ceylanicum]